MCLTMTSNVRWLASSGDLSSLTITKIPKSLEERCEFKNKMYSRNIQKKTKPSN